MLREDIAPALRELGFKGSGKRFTLPSAVYFAAIGIQSSVASTGDRVKFTLNLSVVPKETWNLARAADGSLPATPSPNVAYERSASQWWERIGILAYGSDQWWELDCRLGNQRDRVAKGIIAAVHDFGLPALRAQMRPVPSAQVVLRRNMAELSRPAQ